MDSVKLRFASDCWDVLRKLPSAWTDVEALPQTATSERCVRILVYMGYCEAEEDWTARLSNNPVTLRITYSGRFSQVQGVPEEVHQLFVDHGFLPREITAPVPFEQFFRRVRPSTMGESLRRDCQDCMDDAMPHLLAKLSHCPPVVISGAMIVPDQTMEDSVSSGGDRRAMHGETMEDSVSRWVDRRAMHGETVEDQMMLLFRRDQTIALRRSSEIAELLSCSESAVRKPGNQAWKVFQSVRAENRERRRNADIVQDETDQLD